MLNPDEDRDASEGRLLIAIVNDYDVIIQGVRRMLEPFLERVEVIELDVERNPSRHVDVALFDTYGAGQLGLDRVRSLRESALVDLVVVYTWELTAAARDLLRAAGAGAVISKSLAAKEFVEAIESVGRGEPVAAEGFEERQGSRPARARLTLRESDVLVLLTSGRTNREIAESLFVSENTVRSHLKAVFRKLGVTNRSQAVAWALTELDIQASQDEAVGPGRRGGDRTR